MSCVVRSRLCVETITRPEESYRVRCIWVWLWSLDSEEALAHSSLPLKTLSIDFEPAAPIELAKLRLCVYVCGNHNSSGNKTRPWNFDREVMMVWGVFLPKVTKIGQPKWIGSRRSLRATEIWKTLLFMGYSFTMISFLAGVSRLTLHIRLSTDHKVQHCCTRCQHCRMSKRLMCCMDTAATDTASSTEHVGNNNSCSKMSLTGNRPPMKEGVQMHLGRILDFN
jgi:hypothetical protein